VGFDRAGERLVSAGDDGSVRVWETSTGQSIGEPIRHARPVYHAGFGLDDRWLATACGDGSAYVWSAMGHGLAAPPMRHGREVRYVEVSPDGRAILTAGWDGLVELRYAAGGTRKQPLLRHSSPVMCADFSHDGRRIATACSDGTVRVWDQAGRTVPECWAGHRLSADGNFCVRTNERAVELFTPARRDLSLRRIDSGGVLQQTFVLGPLPFVVTVATLPEGAAHCPQYELRVWDGRSGSPRSRALALTGVVSCVALDAGGKWLAVCQSNVVRFAALAESAWQGEPLLFKSRVRDLALDATGHRLAIASGNDVHVLDPASGQAAFPALRHDFGVRKVLFSDLEDLLVTCTSENTFRFCYAQVWNSRTGQPIGEPMYHRDGIRDAAWLRDGQTLVTVGEDGVGKVWDVREGRLIASGVKHRNQISDVAALPEPQLVLTASWDGTARLWDGALGLPVSPPLPFRYALQAAHFLRAGGGVLVEEVGGMPWSMATPTNAWPQAVLGELAALLSGAIENDGAAEQFRAATTLTAAWRQLKGRTPECFAVTTNEIVAWHRWESEHCRVTKDHAAELQHLEHLLALAPQDAKAAARQADLRQLMLGSGR
jgi:WD40 repeat protein